jgi:multidrug efflux pump subunit AcrA (membrane-fusion protein)
MLHCRKQGVVMARIGKMLAAGLYFVGTTAVSSEVYVTVAPVSELQERVTAEFPASAEPIETSLLSSGISAEILSIRARPGRDDGGSVGLSGDGISS